VENKIENLVKEMDEKLRGKIKTLEILEKAKERKKKRNNNIIKGWEVLKRDSLSHYCGRRNDEERT